MPKDARDKDFQSVLAPFMNQFLQERRATGYSDREPTRLLHRLDDFLVHRKAWPRSSCLDLSSASGSPRSRTRVRGPSSHGSVSFATSPGFCCEPAIPHMCPSPHWRFASRGLSSPEC
jgi:hypothetical protein